MHKRYTIHRDGDLLVEELDERGKPIDPEPVPAEDRLPIEITVLAPDDATSKESLLDLLELAYEIESDSEQAPKPGMKLKVLLD